MTPFELLRILCIAEPLVIGATGNDMDDDRDTLVSPRQIFGFTLPTESESFESDSANDDPPLEPPVPLDVGPTCAVMLVNPGVVTLHGPELFGSLVSGFGMLASNGALDCSSAQCSSIAITDASPNLLVTELELVADGPVVVGNDLGSMTLERSRIELHAEAVAVLSNTGDHVIGAGNADFVVLGEVDGHHRRTAGTNATPITLIRDGEGWQTSSFDITVIDQQGQRWIINIPAGHWR